MDSFRQNNYLCVRYKVRYFLSVIRTLYFTFDTSIFIMKRYTCLVTILFVCVFGSYAQKTSIDTLGITNGSMHMKAAVQYTKFLKKYKGNNALTIHIWYNASGPMVDAKTIKPGDDEIYFLYGRNRSTGSSEMGFVFGSKAKKAFSKKKEDELTELIDFFEFEVFPNQNFAGYNAMDVLEEALE